MVLFQDNLRKHRKTHGIAGPYVCEICHKSFVVKHYYLMHKATHATSETPEEPIEAPPFRCDVCNKGEGQLLSVLSLDNIGLH